MKTIATPNHNKFSETVFGVLDRILREKPNISLIAAESYLLFCHNKTMKWLGEKSESEKEKLLSDAKKDVKSMRQKFVNRKIAIENARQERLNAADRKQRMRRKEQITDEILLWGLWQSEEDVESATERLSTDKDKKAALCAQLRFRKHVLLQKADCSEVYAFSRTVNGKNVKLGVHELMQNVKKLVKDAFNSCHQNQETGDSVPLLVGQNISHCQLVDEERVWFSGKIISQVPGYPVWYNVKYVGDPAIYTYKLLEDYQQGDLKIIV
ncbi:hypothetical protein MAR_027611 [Mya arenaria]|uniref:Uncharacterized protein n=1 Tax=Mya arenaria TaxID=6604 RepID=A0ABY7EXK1_MYAAR|nr:hypothetical protein MAR_027611 [Mya arenaria]